MVETESKYKGTEKENRLESIPSWTAISTTNEFSVSTVFPIPDIP